ncbi:uncharacterized protein LOC123878621 [Maniola jurtina]|uniref:uncharacterized protein LOC123878621 n=1 Tax=Maniola jurtina TaxID=191418 RepID=UPI001E68720A|nr:uncharacterized protein LOC123878621 [Maniola jurtina]
MPLCAVPGCTNSGVHLFPKDPKLKKQWEKVIRRKNFVATLHSRLCRNHFQESDYVGESAYTGYPQICRYLKKGTIPSIFPWSTHVSTTPTSRARRYLARSRRQIDFGQPTVDESIPEPSTSTEIEISTIIESSTEDITPKAISVSTQCGSTLGILSLEAMRGNNKTIHFYTGLENYDKFMLLLDTLTPMCYNLNYLRSTVMNVCVRDQMLITMMKLRRYLPDFELAFLFGISETNVANIFITWINFMYEIWNLIDIWPTKELVEYFMPEAFKRGFPSTRIIVDTTEIPITKPGNPIAQQVTFSNYNHKNTVKAMIGATPGGLISYISECYGGSVSDRQIIERSELVNRCDSGDSIMADRGFNVQDIFATKDVTINIPTYLKGKTQIPGIRIVQDRKLASKRVHIERIIGLAKTYKILKSELSPYHVALSSRILFICAFVCNFRENIMK